MNLNLKKIVIIAILDILAIALSNLIKYYFMKDEGFFLILGAILIPFYFIVAMLYTLFLILRKFIFSEEKALKHT